MADDCPKPSMAIQGKLRSVYPCYGETYLVRCNATKTLSCYFHGQTPVESGVSTRSSSSISLIFVRLYWLASGVRVGRLEVSRKKFAVKYAVKPNEFSHQSTATYVVTCTCPQANSINDEDVL
ncbi:hypothetical protein RF11_07426 [Thelohanellus kitauei]|uniref:Uncharacterized protein n=1 Tax=Thelohanellus kitauei TaxID=669202 RepID=A0A0C2JAM5_THEKT|nr:hypothetical protein RF11_07426 [Thelohanellus kitauei]